MPAADFRVDLERRYVEVKTKLKKAVHNNEKYQLQIQKLNKRIKQLENENEKLNNQIHSFRRRDESESDISSSDRPNEPESSLAALVQSKNLQITELLKDIEDVERENLQLKEKLAETKDELSVATSEISSMTDALKAKEVILQEQYDLTKKLSTDIESLQGEIEQCKKEKNQAEKSLEIFSSEVNERVDEWKALLDKKNEEIAELQKSHPKKSPNSLPAVCDDQEKANDIYVEGLKAALHEAESQLRKLKAELEKCIEDLKDSTDVTSKLSLDKKHLEQIVKGLTENERDLKNQLSKAHDRCQNLQREVELSNKMAKVFEDDLSMLKSEMKERGQIDVATSLENNRSLKVQNLFYEKQIVGLIKDINKLQESCNVLEIENDMLRHQLGIRSGETIDIDSEYASEGRKEQKAIKKLNLDLRKETEEKIKLKMEIKNLNAKVGRLTNEILELNDNRTSGEKIKLSGTIQDNGRDYSSDIRALSEENEALRKGLHEVLKSVQEKAETSPREIKSDILEKLLKALDVKHISGWYHPAMRLQAELHTLEGINSELREQLRQARLEVDDLKINQERLSKNNIVEKELRSTDKENELDLKSTKMHFIEPLFSININNLSELKVAMLKIFANLTELDADITEPLNQEFEFLQKNLKLIHETCNAEKAQLLEKLESDKKEIEKLTVSHIGVNNLALDESANEKNKIEYLIRELSESKNETVKLKQDIKYLEQHQSFEMDGLLRRVINLQIKLRIKEKHQIGSISNKQFKEVENSLNELLVKHRRILTDIEEQKRMDLLETEILKKTNEELTKENTELKGQLNQVLCDSYKERFKHEPDCASLSQKLAEAEVNALSEKQRADHTNNLYNLVKEQLRKSEEKFVEFSKCGENLLQKNLSLQERVVSLEDELSSSVDSDLHKELEKNLNSLLKEKEDLFIEYSSLKEKFINIENSLNQQLEWNSHKEQELLELRHQIVDLTATTEKNFLIGQLHSNLAKYRSEEKNNESKIKFLTDEVDNWEKRYKELSSKTEDERRHFELTNSLSIKKISVLQNIIMKQRIQYHGYVPLVIHEIFAEKIRDICSTQHEAFMNLLSSENPERPVDPEELKDKRDKYLIRKIETQSKQLEKLEQELLMAYQSIDFSNIKKIKYPPALSKKIVSQESIEPKRNDPQIKILRNIESQTERISDQTKEDEITMLKIQIKNYENQMSATGHHLSVANNLLSQKETEIARLTGQLDEKKNKITLLESQVMKLREDTNDKRQTKQDSGAAGDGINLRSNYQEEQILSLRVNLKSMQDKLGQKDIDIMKYQTLLKEDRDKHSLAAANLQKELGALQRSLESEQQKNKSLEEAISMSFQKTSVVEKYISQVRALEKHLADLHTQQTKLQTQLTAAQQEVSRWRQLAQERLCAMQELAESLNEQHLKELTSYKTDYEKLKELSKEDLLRESFVNSKSDLKLTGYIDPDILKLCREKDEKIKELTAKLKEVGVTQKLEAGESVIENEKFTLTKEMENLRRKYEALIAKDRNARDEIIELKYQLSKRNNYSARNKQSEKSIKEQLQRKISQLQKEIDDLHDKLSQQVLLNEKHKITANDDFEKWRKQKYWQENCEKYKSKLQERETELQKLQQACTGYRMLIERLEREKVNLENRIKSYKLNSQRTVSDQEFDILKLENSRLASELAAMQTKMEIRQQGSGALGAAIMQEKLESQERKIAILELSAKGTVEVRNELERLQSSLSNIQKTNLCLEAENLELKMDLEKYSKETPHLQEQLHHLENYIELLKTENQQTERMTESVDDKKVSQLERTVFVLKRVVEKLQVENKRLHSGKRPLSERSSSAEKLKRDFLRLKEQHTENLQKLKDVESKLNAANKRIQFLESKQERSDDNEQLKQVKDQLTHKSLLLEKVKEMLHGAAAREKELLRQINDLRENKEREFDKGCSIEIPSPIEEISEEHSDEDG